MAGQIYSFGAIEFYHDEPSERIPQKENESFYSEMKIPGGNITFIDVSGLGPTKMAMSILVPHHSAGAFSNFLQTRQTLIIGQDTSTETYLDTLLISLSNHRVLKDRSYDSWDAVFVLETEDP